MNDPALMPRRASTSPAPYPLRRRAQRRGRHDQLLWDADDLAELSIILFGDPKRQRVAFVTVSLVGGSDDFRAHLDVLFILPVGADPPPKSLGVVAQGEQELRGERELRPRLAIDRTGDGTLELITGPSGDYASIALISMDPQGVHITQLHFAPNFVCGG